MALSTSIITAQNWVPLFTPSSTAAEAVAKLEGMDGSFFAPSVALLGEHKKFSQLVLDEYKKVCEATGNIPAEEVHESDWARSHFDRHPQLRAAAIAHTLFQLLMNSHIHHTITECLLEAQVTTLEDRIIRHQMPAPLTDGAIRFYPDPSSYSGHTPPAATDVAEAGTSTEEEAGHPPSITLPHPPPRPAVLPASPTASSSASSCAAAGAGCRA